MFKEISDEDLLQKLREEFPKIPITLEEGPGRRRIFVGDREYTQVAWDMSYRPAVAISKMIRKHLHELQKGSVVVRQASEGALYYTYYLYKPTGRRLVQE